MRRDTVRGYVLEELLARLIRGSGYRLLTSPDQDPIDLGWRGNGLVVQGRGSEHQVDVLGQLLWVAAFTFPVRLFVEAKSWGKPVGIRVVREAVGVLADLNQNYRPAEPGSPPLPRYAYNHALFSTSGFSVSATQMAIAHQVSLIDLSTPAFQPLRESIDYLAELISPDLETPTDDELSPDGPLADDVVVGRGISVREARAEMREVLGTIPDGVSPLPPQTRRAVPLSPRWVEFRQALRSTAEDFGEFFVGVAGGPFLLVLRADDPEAFRGYVARRPSHRVRIHWRREDNGREWFIEPEDSYLGTYTLRFALPQTLWDWIFEDSEERPVRAALNVKERFFSDVTIYRFDPELGEDHIYRLTYDARQVESERRLRES
jgi:hypothetical protein